MIRKQITRGVLGMLACCMLLGCSQLGAGAVDEGYTPPIWVRMTLDKEVYQPGEMVVCELEIVNLQDVPIVIETPVSTRFPRTSNLNFRRVSDQDRPPKFLRRAPVVIQQPRTMGGLLTVPSLELPSWGTHTERFAFVNLTRKTGSYQILAEYTAGISKLTDKGPEAIETGAISSAATPFRVEGERLFQRDRAGLIVKDEAIRVAKAKYGKQVRHAEAVLKETESALFDWWVTLERVPSDVGPGEDPDTGYYVSPYGGFVRLRAPAMKMAPSEYFSERMRERHQGKIRKRPPALVPLSSQPK